MHLFIALALFFVAFIPMVLAILWQMRSPLSRLVDAWQIRPSLVFAVISLAIGSLILASVLVMPYEMLVFSLIHAVIGSAIFAVGFERACVPPSVEHHPYWYVGNGNPNWANARKKYAFPRRVSLRWAITFVALLCVCMSVFSAKYREAARQLRLEQSAIAHFQSLGGSIQTVGEANHFAWRLRRSHFANLAGSKVTDADLAKLRDLSNDNATLVTLNLGATDITNEGLQHVAGLVALRSLTLSGSQIDDDGVKQLASLSRLQTLALRQTEVTGTAFPIISERRIELDVSRCPLSLDGIQAISRTKTSTLYLNETEVSDAMVQAISRFDCHTIDLTNTNVSRDVANQIRGPNQVLLGPLRLTPRRSGRND